jgi:hypothetical protein
LGIFAAATLFSASFVFTFVNRADARMRPGAKVEKNYGLGLPRDMDKAARRISDYPVYPLKLGRKKFTAIRAWMTETSSGAAYQAPNTTTKPPNCSLLSHRRNRGDAAGGHHRRRRLIRRGLHADLIGRDLKDRAVIVYRFFVPGGRSHSASVLSKNDVPQT